MGEDKVSAFPRQWLVAIQPDKWRAPLGPQPQMIQVSAVSELQAKRKAIAQVSVGRYKLRSAKQWEITSIQDLTNG